MSNRQIASDCMYNLKQLLPRICSVGINGWDPSLEKIETLALCVYYQPSYEGYGNCPPGYVASEASDLCYQQISCPSSKEQCLTTGASSLSFLDLNPNEQYSILQELSSSRSHESHEEVESNIGLPAVAILSELDPETDEVELKW